jgi:hypothetical protein
MRNLLIGLEQGGADLPVSLAYLVAAGVELDADELRGAVRRAELLLAAGGDPRRELDPDGRAVEALAADLDGAAPRAQLRAGLERLARESHGLPAVEAALEELLADRDRAWRAFACAVLADALSE